MGGVVHSPESLPNFPYKFNITDLKIKLNRIVIPNGLIIHGTFNHRALLFKVVCDYLRLGPVILARGDYGRAWNVLDLRWNVFFCHGPTPALTKSFSQAGSEGSLGKSTQQADPVNTLSSSDKGKRKSAVEVPKASAGGGLAGVTEMIDQLPDITVIVDLMFNPGSLLPVDGTAVRQYLSVP